MLAMSYDAALRREEVCSLESTDIDPAHRLLRIRSEVTKSRRERISPTSDLFGQYLRVRREMSRERGPLFLSESFRNFGQPISIWTWSKAVGRIARRCNLPEFTPHTLRHLCLTDLARTNWDIHEIATFAGHRSVQTTLLYIHLSGRDLSRKLAISMAQIHEQRHQNARGDERMKGRDTIKNERPNNFGRWFETLTPEQRSVHGQHAARALWGPKKDPPPKGNDGPWVWPIDVERYDRSPALTAVETDMLTRYAEAYRFYRYGRTMDFGPFLDRLVRPLNDVFDYTGIKTEQRRYVLLFFLREMARRNLWLANCYFSSHRACNVTSFRRVSTGCTGGR